jgi:ribonuclease HIII
MVTIPNVTLEHIKDIKGFTKVPTKTKYEVLRLKGDDLTLILYTSGKFLMQGNEDKAHEIAVKHFNHKPKKKVNLTGTIVGSDETLKGDTFGGLVVVAIKADEKERESLKKLGVDDSKKLTDNKIIDLAQIIINNYTYIVKELYPKDYNNELEKMNTTKLLDKLHFDANIAIKTKDSIHIVDKYPGCNVGDKAIEKAESKFIEVAAASIVARYIALLQMNALSNMVGFKLPLGSTHVEPALKKVKKLGLDFSELTKLNFKNVKKYL